MKKKIKWKKWLGITGGVLGTLFIIGLISNGTNTKFNDITPSTIISEVTSVESTVSDITETTSVITSETNTSENSIKTSSVDKHENSVKNSKSDSENSKNTVSNKNKTEDSKEESKNNVTQNSEKQDSESSQIKQTVTVKTVNPSSLPAYNGNPYVVVNNNAPVFPDITTKSYEYYSDLDSLGRCGMAIACVGKDLMPTEERGSIGMIKPSGWHTVKYDNVSGKYLYNRCHLIGYQLTAENANKKNLITGTRYLNVDGMLPFENMVADYIKETGNHVMYRVTPVFENNNLVASGVQMEAYSVEDTGAGICFNVYCYNVQPGVIINYADGSSKSNITESSKTIIETSKEVSHSEQSVVTKPSTPTESKTPVSNTYILNTNTKKFHYSDCSSVKQMKDNNKKECTGDRDDLIAQGYEPCKRCNP